MAAKRDYYEVLGVARDSDAKTIKASYRKLAMQYHPDRNPDNPEAEERFKEAAEAYEVLSDESKRRLYDRGGFEGLRNSGFAGGAADLGDIFAQFGDIFADFFGAGGFGGFGGQRGPRPTVGNDIRFDLEITLEDALQGVTREVEIPRNHRCDPCNGTGAKGGEVTTCPTCGGRGQVVSGRGGFMIATTCRACMGRGRVAREACAACSGAGKREQKKRLDVRIPPGVDSGVRLRLQGEGDAGELGGPHGDLYVFISVGQHERFLRDQADLHCELAIGFPLACLGGQTAIKALDGSEAQVEIPEGAQPGDTVRLAGLGMPRLGGRGQGDLIVHITINVPQKLKKSQRDAIEALERELDQAPELTAPGARQRETRNRKKGSGFFDRIRDALEGE